MTSLFSTFRRLLFALTLLASGSACAGPAYHVTVDTAGLSGSGFLDFAVIGAPGAPGAIASVSGLTGDFGPELERVGQVAGGIPAGFTLANGVGDNYLTQAVTFGGLFAFDIRFAGDYETVNGIDGATFAIGWFDAAFSQYTLAATFAAQPGNALEAASLTPTVLDAAVTVSEVPEPSQLVLVWTAIAAALALRARRSLASKRRHVSGSQHMLAANCAAR